MERIQRLDGKDPITVVRLKQPVRDGKREMGKKDDNEGQQERLANLCPFQSFTLSGQTVVGHGGVRLFVDQEMPQQEKNH